MSDQPEEREDNYTEEELNGMTTCAMCKCEVSISETHLEDDDILCPKCFFATGEE